MRLLFQSVKNLVRGEIRVETVFKPCDAACASTQRVIGGGGGGGVGHDIGTSDVSESNSLRVCEERETRFD